MAFDYLGEASLALAGLPADDLKGRLYDGDELRENHAELYKNIVLDKFKGAERAAKEDQYKRGIGDKGKSIETVLKPIFERYGIGSKIVEEGLQELTAKLEQMGKTTVNPDDLTPEKLETLPVFHDLFRVKTQKIVEEKEALQRSLVEKQNEWQQQRIRDLALIEVPSVLERLNADFGDPNDKGLADRKKNQINFFLSAIGTGNLRKNESGEWEILKDDGSPMLDEAYNPLTFDGYIKTKWESAGYRFHKVDPNKQSPQFNKGNGGAGSFNGITITSQAHFEKLLNEARGDNAKAADIREAYADYLDKQAK